MPARFLYQEQSRLWAPANDDDTDTDGTNPVTIDVLANDVGVGGMLPGTVAIIVQPTHGNISVNMKNGKITYTAKANFTGTDTFRYSVRDAAGDTSEANVSVRVNRPVAADDWIDTDGTNPVTISVLDNDSDPDGNSHIQFPGSVTRISNPAHGTVTFDATTNSFTYTANADFTGTDSFRYIVTDDAGAASMPATVFVRVNRPVAADDFATTHGTDAVTISVLDNDSDPDGNAHIQYSGSVTQMTSPLHGTVTFDAATNSFKYTAAVGFIGVNSFQYTVTDDAGATSMPATVRISVLGPNVVNLSRTVTGASIVINVANFASDPEGASAITGPIVVVTSPKHGSFVIDQVHLLITYTPDAGFAGSDSFTYTVTDSFGVVSNVATVDLTVPMSTQS
jgi:large repetitive protein